MKIVEEPRPSTEEELTESTELDSIDPDKIVTIKDICVTKRCEIKQASKRSSLEELVTKSLGLVMGTP